MTKKSKKSVVEESIKVQEIWRNKIQEYSDRLELKINN